MSGPEGESPSLKFQLGTWSFLKKSSIKNRGSNSQVQIGTLNSELELNVFQTLSLLALSGGAALTRFFFGWCPRSFGLSM